MFMKFIYGIIIPILAVFVSNVFDLNYPYSIIFMGIFTGVAMALVIRHNLFIYTVGSIMVLLILNYGIVMYKYGNEIYEILGQKFGNIFVLGAGFLMLCVSLSALLVYLLKLLLDNKR